MQNDEEAARPYARALAQAAQDLGLMARVRADMEALEAQWEGSEPLRRWARGFHSMPRAQHRATVDALWGDTMAPPTRKLLEALSVHGLLAAIPDCRVNGDTENRLPNTSNIAFKNVEGEAILLMLDRLGIHNKMVAFHKFNSKEKAPELVKLMQEGATIAEISDAGMPVISDPGFILVQECIKNNVPVVPLPGPSAFATALIASGFDGQPFTYYGFLPRKASQQYSEDHLAEIWRDFYQEQYQLGRELGQISYE